MNKPKVRLNEITAKYIGAPHRLGGKTFEDGYDCFSLCLALGEDFGQKIPYDFEDLDQENYVALFEKDKKKAIKRMIDFLKSVAREIPAHEAFVGDIYILEDSQGNIFSGIHAGNDLVMSSFIEFGVRCEHLRKYTIRGVYRWAVQ